MNARTQNAGPGTVLFTLTGRDRPGVTSLTLDTLARFGVEVLDIEQIVLRGRLVLGLLVSSPRDWRPLNAPQDPRGYHDAKANLARMFQKLTTPKGGSPR